MALSLVIRSLMHFEFMVLLDNHVNITRCHVPILRNACPQYYALLKFTL